MSDTTKVSLWQRILVGRNVRTTLLRILLLVIVVFAAVKWAVILVRIDGISMEPTLHDRQIKVINRLVYRTSEPQRGDIVSIGELGREGYMKRIIALPGETYSMRAGQMFINDEPLEEPYVVNKLPWHLPAVTLGPTEYLVIGDNRGMRQEDHYFGRVDRKFILGKLWF